MILNEYNFFLNFIKELFVNKTYRILVKKIPPNSGIGPNFFIQFYFIIYINYLIIILIISVYLIFIYCIILNYIISIILNIVEFLYFYIGLYLKTSIIFGH